MDAQSFSFYECSKQSATDSNQLMITFIDLIRSISAFRSHFYDVNDGLAKLSSYKVCVCVCISILFIK